MQVRAIVLVVALAFIFGYCVFLLGGCAFSVVDGNRSLHLEVFMPYQDIAPPDEELALEIADLQLEEMK